MKKFVVVYQEFEGDTEVFGTFDSFEEAYNWMKTDFDRNIMILERQKIKADTEVTKDSMSIKDTGKWNVYGITEAQPIF